MWMRLQVPVLREFEGKERKMHFKPLYYLIFAGPNRTGARIARNVLKQGTRRIQ